MDVPDAAGGGDGGASVAPPPSMDASGGGGGTAGAGGGLAPPCECPSIECPPGSQPVSTPDSCCPVCGPCDPSTCPDVTCSGVPVVSPGSCCPQCESDVCESLDYLAPCGAQIATLYKANMLLVYDKSGSMTVQPPGFSTDLWSATAAALIPALNGGRVHGDYDAARHIVLLCACASSS